MSIFGKLDAANIPTNPYFIKEGEYPSEISDAKYHNNKSNGQRQLVIQMTVTDESSEFLDSTASLYFDLPDLDMTIEQFELLPNEEKKKIRKAMSAIKRTLCGNPSNEKQKGLGVSEEDLNNDEWDPKVLVGTPVTMAITNYGSGPTKEGVNIKWVNLREE